MVQVRKGCLCEGFCKKTDFFLCVVKPTKSLRFCKVMPLTGGKGTDKLIPQNHNESLHHSVVPLPLGKGGVVGKRRQQATALRAKSKVFRRGRYHLPDKFERKSAGA